MNFYVKKNTVKTCFEIAAGMAAAAVVSFGYQMWAQFDASANFPAVAPVSQATPVAPVIDGIAITDPELISILNQSSFLKERIDEMSKDTDHLMNSMAIDAMQNGNITFSGNIVKASIPAGQDSAYTYTFNFSAGVPESICYTNQTDCKNSPELDQQQKQDLRVAVCREAAKQGQSVFTALNCQGLSEFK